MKKTLGILLSSILILTAASVLTGCDPVSKDQLADGFFVSFSENECTVTGIENKAEENVVIPETINGKPVIAAQYIFDEDGKNIISVTLPDSIEYIDEIDAMQICGSQQAMLSSMQ